MNWISKILDLQFDNILHVGAHQGEEMEDYCNCNSMIRSILWVEADEANCAALQNKIERSEFSGRQSVSNSVVWSHEGVEVDFHIASEGMSSSVLQPHDHLSIYPSIKFLSSKRLLTSTLDKLCDGKIFDFVNLDIQGAELEALKGFKIGLKSTSVIYCEVNRRELYKEGAQYEEIIWFLERFDFQTIGVAWTMQGWGDALFVRKGLEINFFRKRIFTLLVTSLNVRSCLSWTMLQYYKSMRIKLNKVYRRIQ